MTTRKTASLAGFALPTSSRQRSLTRRPLQDLRGKFMVDSAHIVLIWYNASECIIDYLKIIVP